MSLINQVLKDLDRQRGPADGVQVAALQGVGLVQNEHTNWSTLLSRAGWGLAALLLAFVGFQLADDWKFATDQHSTGPPLVSVNTPPRPITTIEQPDKIEAVIGTVIEAEPAPELTGPVKLLPVDTELVAAEQPVPPVASAPNRLVKTLSARQKADHAFVTAQRAMDRQDIVSAEQQFNDVLALYPQHMSARIQLASIYFDRDNSEAAATVLEQGLSLDPGQPQIARLYAQLLATRGDLRAALLVLEPVIDSRQADAESLALRAAIYARLELHQDAESSYRQALKLEPGKANWWLGLGLALEHQGREHIALGAYQQADKLPLADNVKTFVQQRIQQLQIIARDS